MEHVSSSPIQSEASCAEPEIMEVLLRNKRSRTRAERMRGVELQSDLSRGRGRLTQMETAQPNKVACERLLCERCICPSRLWLHHTCRAAKPAVGTDQNVCFTAVTSKARNVPQATGKILIRRHMLASSSTALSSLSSVTARCSSGEQQDTHPKENAVCLLQHRARLASVRADTEAVTCWQVKSPVLRRRKSFSTQNCHMNLHPGGVNVVPQSAHAEKPSQRSGKPAFASPEAKRYGGRGIQKHGTNVLRNSCACGTDDKKESAVRNGCCIFCSKPLQQLGPAVQQNRVQCTFLRTETKDSSRFAPRNLDADSFYRRQCSAAGRGYGDDKEMATKGSLAKSEDDGGYTQSGWHALSLRHCSCRAAEGVQNICQELTVAVADKKGYRQLDGRKEDVGGNIRERHSQTAADVGKRATDRILTRHYPVCRRHTTDSLACTTGRERNNRIYGKAGVAKWDKEASWKQKVRHWKVWEAENNLSVITAPVENFGVSQVAQQELPVSKGMMHGASPCRCELLNEDRRTKCTEESFMTRSSGAATASDRNTQEEIYGMEASSENDTTHLSASRKGSCPDSSLSFCHFEERVKAAVHSASADDISDGAKKCEAATSGYRNEAAEVNTGRPCSERERRERECVAILETSAGAFMAEQRRKWEGKAVRSCSASERWTHPCSGAFLEPRSEQPRPVTEIHNERCGTKRRDFVASNFKGIKMQVNCICEHVGQFLDTVECFLRESDPQLRREKLYGLHAVFVSVRAG